MKTTVFALQELDDRTLKDIGVDRSAIESAVRCCLAAASTAP